MKIPCVPICFGCSANNCENCFVLHEYLKRNTFVSIHGESKKDFDLENHFVGGL